MEKQCSKCGLVKDIEQFDKKRKSHAAHCKDCRKAMVKSHYDNNTDYYKKKAVKGREKATEKYTEYKRSLKCNDCNLPFKEEPFLCDFHHLDPNKKDFEPASISKGSWNKLMEELSKCIPLCANCHRRRHRKGLIA